MKSATYKKSLSPKKPSKSDREQAVLVGLVELYLKTGRPIGSHTLQENGFDELSPATIRNYFSKLESEGYLTQQHTSGGRVPTEKGFRFYADLFASEGLVERGQEEDLEKALQESSKEVNSFLNRVVEHFSEMTQCAVFVSSPRFDQDFIADVRLIQLDATKLLSILITNFGLIKTETVYLERDIDPEFVQATQKYFLWRLNQGEKPLFKDEGQKKLAQKIYNEVIVRHVVGYANFPEEDVIRTGLSKLLSYPEFNDAAALASSLSLLEDKNAMRFLLRKSSEKGEMVSWIGDELYPSVPKGAQCCVIAIPYRINHAIGGSIAILGPLRIPYKNLFGLLQIFSKNLSESLTESLYKHQITFRHPTGSKQIEVQ